MKRNLMAMILLLCLMASTCAGAEGLLPSLTDTIGKPMPSLGEALGRYPDDEIPNDDGSNTEVYHGVTEIDFNTFSVYLNEQAATLAEYQTSGTAFSASIQVDGNTLYFCYDTQTLDATITYPKGTYNEWVKNAKTRFATFVSLVESGQNEEALNELLMIENASSYMPLIEYLTANGYETIEAFVNEMYFSIGVAFLNNGDLNSAFAKWSNIEDNSYQGRIGQEVYTHACDLINENKIISALILLRTMDEEKCNNLRARIESFLCSLYVPDHNVQYILKPDGTVVNFNGNVVERNAVKIGYHLALVVLKRDGTVVSYVDWGNIRSTKWKNIVDIQCELYVYAGLKKDGTVIAEWKYDGDKYESVVENWKGIKQIAVCEEMVYGLKSDGTVVEAGERYDRFNSTKTWKNIVEIVFDGRYLYGLKSDGTIVSTSKDQTSDLTWAKILFRSAEGLAQVNPDGTTPIQEMSSDTKKTWGEAMAGIYSYLHNATHCLALPRFDNTFGIIREDGTLVLLKRGYNRADVSETSWKLWIDETELGELYNMQYRVQ